ncbi:MucR family transcriptional regulator [Mesorhizobium sp. CO1-1-7]|uniref:MucR family transcriptional regulator n=1 Tax=Mesorhizobium sp. CO1-1-7 TaxID=2876632 RepID=UPI001CD0F952|nr:MucR family transcriptional regulator [Mesorhizobium sp. CO1-1-7]
MDGGNRLTDENSHPSKTLDLLELTAHIVSAYVEKNRLPASGLPELIASVSASISGLGQPVAPVAAPLVPAVNPKKSVTPDFIICLEDGKKFKSLKRHLGVHFGLTPDAYRAKWGLPSDYPMVAPNYAASRSELAKSIGLGRKAAVVAAVKGKGRKAKVSA